jgi:formate transporter
MAESLYADPAHHEEPGTYEGTPVLDFVKPHQLVQTIIDTGAAKGDLSVGQILVRGALGGAFLAYGTGMAFLGVAQGLPAIVAGALFPLGFIIINILQVDLATGYFCYVPLALLNGRTTFGKLIRCFCWVYVANLIGSLIVAGLFWAAVTTWGKTPDASGMSAVLVKVGTAKTLHYIPFGWAGYGTAFVKGILCNWFVTLGVILPMATRSVIGKAIMTFVPIYLFFGMGWEHLVVNMFIIPSAMMYGAPITLSNWWIQNELPVTIGNFCGGFFFTACTIGWIYRAKRTTEA